MARKVFIYLFLSFLILNQGYGQSISLVNNQTATTLANKLAGSGVTVSGATLSCNILSNGLFANVNPFPTQSLAIDSGVVLCTGRVLSTATDTGINASVFKLASNNMLITSSDPQISSIAGATAVQKDLCYLQFNFVPKGDSAFIDYTFASEDYPEYACSQFVDAFGIFVSPPSGIFTNYAKVPGTNINVSINSINDTTKQTGASNYSTYCTSMGSGAPFIQYYVANTISNHLVYDGMTKILKARFSVLPNQTHTMKIAIADILDANFDSGLFLKQYSLTSPSLLEIIERKSTNSSTVNPLYLIEGCNPGTVKFNRSSNASALTVNVAFSGTASASDYSGATSFTIPVGSSTYTYNISALLDGLTESPESLKLTFTCPSLGFVDSANYTIKDFANGINIFNATNDTTICNGKTVVLNYSRPDTTFVGVWNPGTNLSCTNCLSTTYTSSNGNIFSSQTVKLTISAVGCASVDTTVTINIQPKPNIMLAPAFSLCKGDSVQLNAFASPAGIYTYSWTPGTGLSSTTISNPFAKPNTNQSYKLIVSTSSGCKDSLSTSVSVFNIRAEIDSMVKTNTTCGTSNGSISLYTRTSAPFNPPYQYSINGGTSFVSANIFNGLATGVYNVAIKNATNCRFDTTLTITSGATAPSATFIKTNTSCGLNNGSATVSAKSGKAPLTLTWKLGVTVISTDTFINNKASGVYTLVVTDSGGCVTQYAVNILSSTAPSIFFTKIDQTCGANNGAVIASPSGGSSPYTYLWNTGVTINSISGLVAGTYKLTLSDASGCVKIDSTALISFPAIVHSKSKTNSSCGLPNGAAQAIITSGGNPPFIYSWNNGSVTLPTTSTSHTIFGLSPGIYIFTITDSKGCTKTDTLNVSTTPSVSVSLNKTNAICGNPNGSITTTVLSGSPSYTYLWQDGVTTQNRASIPIGTYTITVTDINGCTVAQSTTLTTNSNPVLTLTRMATTCGKNNGSISSTIVGAKPPIVFAWSNGKSSNFIDSLAAGIYTLTITDSNGCQKTAFDTVKMTPFSNFTDTTIHTTCGLNNGSIILSNITGLAPIAINWADGGSSSSRSGLSPGIYTVNVQDGNGCIKNKTFIIASSNLPTASFSVTNAMCANTVGSIVSGASSGVAPYTYLWSSGETTANIVNKPKGLYSVTITDSKGCVKIASDSIRRLPSPTYKDTLFKARCGLANGWLNIYNVVGSGPMTYLWQHDASINYGNLTNLNSTVYYVKITDANGCQVFDTFDLSSNGPISLTYSIKKPTCKNSNGVVTLNMIGGNAPYTIQWQNGDTGIIADSLKHGKYGFNIVDKLGCTYVDTIKVKDSTKLTDSFKIIKTRCDTPTGQFITYPYGGPAPFKYIWERSLKDTFSLLDSVRIGFYKVQIIDSNGCKFDTSAFMEYTHYPQIRDSIIIERCDSANGKIFIKIDSVINPIKIWWNGTLDSTYSKTNLTGPQMITILVQDSQKCVVTKQVLIDEVPVSYPVLVKTHPPCGNNTGQLTVAIDIPKTFIWNNGATTQNINSLAPGVYTVTITDTTGCKFIRKDSLFYTIEPTRTYAYTRSNCGLFDGKIKVTVNSLYGPFNYLWNKVPISFPIGTTTPGSDSVVFTSLDSGKYQFKITDAVGCIKTDTIYLKDSSAPTFKFNITNSNCINGIGRLKAVPLSGKAPYTYFWYNFTTIDSVANLVSGSYPVTITDARSCTVSGSGTIISNPKPDLNLIGVNSKCGPNNGQIVTNVSFGKPPFTYNWSNGATTKDLTNLGAGKYVLTITDSIGCTDIDSFTIFAEPLLQISTINTVAFCGLNNGTATATILSGKPPYTYNWNGSINSLSISGIDSGRHIFFIQDSNGCIKRDTQYITRVSKPTISQSIVNDNCSYSLGKITSTITGGQAPLSYLWSSGLGTTASVSNILAGTYSFSVTDNLGCQVVTTVIVGDTAGPIVSLAVTAASCGLNNGSINATITSVKTPLSYFWNNISGTTSKININGGKYVFKVVDNRGCQRLDSVLLDTVFPLTTTTNFKQASCNLNNSFIKINPKGGTGAYTYTWGHMGQNVDSIFNLSPGNYRVTTSDIKGCTWVDSFVITQLGFPTITFNNNPAKCRASNGSINAVISNFSGSYTYLWNTGETSAILTGKSANTYTLTISDGLSCVVSYSTTLTTAGVDSIDVTLTHPKCDINNGKINTFVYNSIGKKTYTWSPAAPNKDSLTNVGGGNYSLTVSDSFCTISSTSTLVMANSPQLTLSKQDASCGINNGRIISSTVLGLAPLNYVWNNTAVSANLLNVDSGSYSVTVTDMNNCSDTANLYLPRLPMLTANFVKVKTTCGAANGSIQTTTTGGKTPYTYLWNSGQITSNLSNIPSGNYILTISDNGNCTITENILLEDFKKPKINSNILNAVCGQANGKIDITITDGNPKFKFIWSTGDTVQNLINLNTGFYRLTVTDSIGCKDSSLMSINPGTTPMIEWPDSTHSTCGLANGKLKVDLPRGVDPKTYVWSNGATGSTLNNVAPGLYFVTVSDQRGCTVVGSIVVKTSTVPKLSFTSTNSYCNKANGVIFSSVNQGTPGYRYKWSNGSNTPVISNAAKGLHWLVVLDTFGCKDSATYNLSEDKNNVYATIQRFDLVCHNDLSGKVIITPSGGEYPYTYNVNSPAPDSIVTNLSAFKYTYTVEDNKGCIYQDTFSLKQPNKLKSTLLSKKDLICYNEPTGQASVYATGGIYPYKYYWSNGQITNYATNLFAGTHVLTVTDANLCFDTSSYIINQPPDIKVGFNLTNNPCNGQSLGKIDLSTGLGTPPYTFKWSTGATTEDISSLKEGKYNITITDANGCIDKFNYGLIDPLKLELGSVVSKGLKCKGIIDGELFVQALGGIPPFKYSIDSGRTFNFNNRFTNLQPKNYQIIIKDNNDCRTFVNSTVADYPNFKIKANPKESTIMLDQSVMLGYTVIDGNPSWVNKSLWKESEGLSCVDCETPLATPYTSRSYIVEVNYLDKCYAYDTIKITVIDDGNIYVPNAFTPGHSSHAENNTFKLYGKNIVKAHMVIYDRIGEKMFETQHGNIDGWDGKFKNTLMPANVYYYSISITYLNKRIVEHRGEFTLFR